MTQESATNENEQGQLQMRLLQRQSCKCLIYDREIGLLLHKGVLEIDGSLS